MVAIRARIPVRTLVVIAGATLLADTLMGALASLGLDPSFFRDIITMMCLSLAFPIFLVGFFSLRAGVMSLWIFLSYGG